MLPSRTVGSKGRRDPFIERVGRLNVVVSVAQDRWFAGGVQPICVNQRVLRGGNDFNIFEAGGLHAVGDKLSGAQDIGHMLRGKVLTLGIRRKVLSSSRRRG